MTKSKQLVIELLNNQTEDISKLTFDLFLENKITHRWIKKVKAAQRLGYDIDDRERFYGFDNVKIETNKALQLINNDIDVINQYQPIINRHLEDISDQNTLNYLHKIFEDYHGLLDQQTHEFWNNAPKNVREALANLNVHVHRCESVYRSNKARFVITYFGLPKKHKFEAEDFKLLTNRYEFGTVYINYVEIGKTLEDYWRDDELGSNAHAGHEAFKPFNYFSADFVVRFHDYNQHEVNQTKHEIKNYFMKHREFFEGHGVLIDNDQLRPGFIPVAKINSNLSNNEILEKIKTHQHVHRVYFL
jgi:hypothetical protein